MSVKPTYRLAVAMLCATLHRCVNPGRSSPFALIVSVNLLLPKPERTRGLPHSLSKSVVYPYTTRGRRSAPSPCRDSVHPLQDVSSQRSCELTLHPNIYSLRHTVQTLPTVQASTDSVDNAGISVNGPEITTQVTLSIAGPSI